MKSCGKDQIKAFKSYISEREKNILACDIVLFILIITKKLCKINFVGILNRKEKTQIKFKKYKVYLNEYAKCVHFNN